MQPATIEGFGPRSQFAWNELGKKEENVKFKVQQDQDVSHGNGEVLETLGENY